MNANRHNFLCLLLNISFFNQLESKDEEFAVEKEMAPKVLQGNLSKAFCVFDSVQILGVKSFQIVE